MAGRQWDKYHQMNHEVNSDELSYYSQWLLDGPLSENCTEYRLNSDICHNYNN
jgi:hypothetical protein